MTASWMDVKSTRASGRSKRFQVKQYEIHHLNSQPAQQQYPYMEKRTGDHYLTALYFPHGAQNTKTAGLHHDEHCTLNVWAEERMEHKQTLIQSKEEGRIKRPLILVFYLFLSSNETLAIWNKSLYTVNIDSQEIPKEML